MGGATAALRAADVQQDAQVLHRGDEPVLDSLTPQPPPTAALEAVAVGGIGKTFLHQVHPSAPVLARSPAVALGAGRSQKLFLLVAVQRGPGARTRAWASQGTGCAHAARGDVFPSAFER